MNQIPRPAGGLRYRTPAPAKQSAAETMEGFAEALRRMGQNEAAHSMSAEEQRRYTIGLHQLDPVEALRQRMEVKCAEKDAADREMRQKASIKDAANEVWRVWQWAPPEVRERMHSQRPVQMYGWYIEFDRHKGMRFVKAG